MHKRQPDSMLQRLLARLRGPAVSSAAPTVKPRPFQAVAVFRGAQACSMAHRFSDHRFLAKDAPPLPLAGCTMATRCTCRYLKFKDRRDASQRRLIDVGLATQMFSGKERRFARGRRAADR